MSIGSPQWGQTAETLPLVATSADPCRPAYGVPACTKVWLIPVPTDT